MVNKNSVLRTHIPSFPSYVSTLGTFGDYLNTNWFLRLSRVDLQGSVPMEPVLHPLLLFLRAVLLSRIVTCVCVCWGGGEGATKSFSRTQTLSQTARIHILTHLYHRYMASDKLLKSL